MILNPVPVTTFPAALRKSPFESVLMTKYSPAAAPIIVIPTDGLNWFNPPKPLTPTKNGVANVTSNPEVEVPEFWGNVDVLPPVL